MDEPTERKADLTSAMKGRCAQVLYHHERDRLGHSVSQRNGAPQRLRVSTPLQDSAVLKPAPSQCGPPDTSFCRAERPGAQVTDTDQYNPADTAGGHHHQGTLNHL